MDIRSSSKFLWFVAVSAATGSDNNRVGLAKSFEVNPGEVFDREVYAKYEASFATFADVNPLLSQLVSAFPLGAATSPLDGAPAYSAFAGDGLPCMWRAFKTGNRAVVDEDQNVGASGTGSGRMTSAQLPGSSSRFQIKDQS